MQIAIFGNKYHAGTLSLFETISHYLTNEGATILLNDELYRFIREGKNCCIKNTEIIESDNFQADLALSIGGDGTFMNTAAHVGRKNIPILGVNIGRLGFLADIASENIIPALDAFFTSRYAIEERSLVRVETSNGTLFDYPYALNEVAVLKQDSSSMISINASVNGETIHTYHADGLLVSTPTGSTAYSLSVGGPIVVPQSETVLLSPVASHSLNVRPLIIPDTWIVELEVRSQSKCFLLSIDGRSKVMEQTTRLKITKADYSIKIVKQPDQTFFNTLKNKLMWGVDKRMM